MEKPEEKELTAEAIYKQIQETVADKRKAAKPAREISGVYLWGAGRCRDKGNHKHTLELFEAAIKEDPTNADAHRIFADFLFGYRGLYEEAAIHYYEAERLIESEELAGEHAEKEHYDTKGALKRSVQILHRDGGDGIPLKTSKSFSAFLETFFEYRRASANHFSSLTMLEEEIRLVRTYLADIGAMPPSDTLNAFRDALPRRREEIIYGANLLFRSANPRMPYFKLSWVESENTKNASVENVITVFPDSVNQLWERDGRSVTGSIGRDVRLSDHLDFEYELGYTWAKTRVINPQAIGSGYKIEEEEKDELGLDGAFSYRMGANTLKLSFGLTLADIDGLFSDTDSLNTQRLALRYSVFPPPIAGEDISRFRGRRSTHYEAGIVRTERTFREGTTQKDFQPHLAYEELGLFRGYWDATFVYLPTFRDKRSPGNFGHGKYDAHEFRFIPAYIPIYKLYDNDFETGIEHVRVSFPMRWTIGEGSYDHINAGAKVEVDWEVRRGFRLIPSLAIDYAHYTKLNRDDWGIFLKIVNRF